MATTLLWTGRRRSDLHGDGERRTAHLFTPPQVLHHQSLHHRLCQPIGDQQERKPPEIHPFHHFLFEEETSHTSKQGRTHREPLSELSVSQSVQPMICSAGSQENRFKGDVSCSCLDFYLKMFKHFPQTVQVINHTSSSMSVNR